jgi:hypothetical protein
MGPRLDTTHYDVVYLMLHDVSWTSLDTIQAYLHCDPEMVNGTSPRYEKFKKMLFKSFKKM